MLAVDRHPGAPALPQRARPLDGGPGLGPLGDAGLDEPGLGFPLLQVGPGPLLLLAPGVLGGAGRPLLLHLPVDAGQCGDGVEDPGRAELVQRLGEQVRGGAGPDRGGQERDAAHVPAVQHLAQPVGVDVVPPVAPGQFGPHPVGCGHRSASLAAAGTYSSCGPAQVDVRGLAVDPSQTVRAEAASASAIAAPGR